MTPELYLLNHLEFVLFREHGPFVLPNVITTADYVSRASVDLCNISEVNFITTGSSIYAIIVVSRLDNGILAENLENARSHLLQPHSLLAGQIASVLLVTVVILATAGQGDAQADVLAAEAVRWIGRCCNGLGSWNTMCLGLKVVKRQLIVTWGKARRGADGD